MAKYYFLLNLMFFGLLVGCVSTRPSAVSITEFNTLTSGRTHFDSYHLVSGDLVEFSLEVDGVKEIPLQEARLVGALGVVTLPLVGDIQLGGLKPDKAKMALLAEYSKFYDLWPSIVFNVLEKTAAKEIKHVTVLGQVQQPGRHLISSDSQTYLSETIRGAGGFNPSAKVDSIEVSREVKSGERIFCVVDLENIGVDGASEDLMLQSGDVIFVPKRRF